MSDRPAEPLDHHTTAANAKRGRGSLSNPDSRYAAHSREAVDDGWWQEDTDGNPRTELGVDSSRSIISYNDSPDIPFDRSVNPYRGCEHGCIYCYARPTHAWLGLSPGLDFERRLFHKPDAAAQLRRALAQPGYRPATLVLGANTDPYQPIERRLGSTRAMLEVLSEARHPLAITTKSALVLRDLPLLRELAARRLVAVQMSVTTLDDDLARRLEPRATAPRGRLRAVAELAAAGIPTGVLVSPLIPGLTDHDLERIVAAAAEVGAERAGALLIRLPLELKALFEEWLRAHYPERADKVLSLIRQCRGGALNVAEFGQRMTGTGPLAELLQQRFGLALRRHGLERQDSGWNLSADAFHPPAADPRQLSLFD
ncbi:MAG: PA0069 family radical SAM protein [Thiohalocapsa sp.]|uniref:PA0069 family radical SAM protein n=1 Tax=Thiohalocapsa sp. TaxID=2497641 RepID=UPI0025FE22B4|nr:PA0069 family radical SAM protein [Thiohalocapsa sp.]MCG6940734.1 PA0069 family radical SAM protein [Thiohalocapsa sp.]